MKILELNQMESTQGGWSWGACAVGAMTTTLGGAGYVAILGGPVGLAVVAGIGCVLAGVAI